MMTILTLAVIMLPGETLSIGDLRQGVLDRETAIQTFTMRAHLDTVLRDENKTISFQGSEELTIYAEPTGRIRYESSGLVHEQSGKRSEKVLGAYNGTEARSMRSLGADRFVVGEIDRNRSTVYMRVDPREFITWFFGKPVSVEIGLQGAALIGEEKWDGSLTYVVEVEHAPPLDTNILRKSRLLIDPSRGFAVVRRSVLARTPPATKVSFRCNRSQC